MSKFLLKVNRIVFWWYYKRVPEFFHQWTILKSIRLLKDNYEHSQFVIDGNNKVIANAIKIEKRMQSEISTLKLKMAGISQDKIDPFNKAFGTNLKGKSSEEINN